APGPIAEVTLQLAQDGRDGEGGKGYTGPWIVAIDGQDEADQGDLSQVVERLTPAGESPGHPVGQIGMGRDKLVAQVRIPAVRVSMLQVDQLVAGRSVPEVVTRRAI